jgi:glutaredoxin
LRNDHACPHCRSAFSLLDPKAVEQALTGYAKAVSNTGVVNAPQLADALVMLERDRAQALREAKNRGDISLPGDTSTRIDLWGIGLAMVWKILN